MAWVFYSLIAAVGFGIISLILTHLSRAKISPLIVNTWFWSATPLIFLTISLITSPKQMKVQANALKWFALLSFVAVITNLFSVKALQVGPNTGLVRSIQMAQIVVATLGGIYLFHEGVSPKAVIGIVLVIVGIILI